MSEAVIERPAAPSLISRVIGVITAPRATFEKVVAAPRVGGMLALIAVVSGLCVGGLLMTEKGQQSWIDQQVEAQEAWRGQPMSDQQYEQVRKMAPIAGYLAFGQFLFMFPIMALIFSGILYAIFNALMGGNATFKQVMAVVVHSQVISMLAMVIGMPLAYAKGSMTGATNLAVLLPMLDESSFLARFLGMMDLFLIWWLVVLAIGLSVLYRRKTSSIATILFGIYIVIALGVAAFLSRG